MAEYIDKQTAVHCTDGELEITGEENMVAVADYIQSVVQKLRTEPGINIVMCRDCKHYTQGYTAPMCTNRIVKYVKPNDFCSWGEGREE